MTRRKWKVQGKIYDFPSDWDLDRVHAFVNQFFRFCPFCLKPDIPLKHLNECYETLEDREARIDNWYK